MSDQDENLVTKVDYFVPITEEYWKGTIYFDFHQMKANIRRTINDIDVKNICVTFKGSKLSAVYLIVLPTERKLNFKQLVVLDTKFSRSYCSLLRK